MTALQNILIRGLSYESGVWPSLNLLAYAGVFVGLALWRSNFK